MLDAWLDGLRFPNTFVAYCGTTAENFRVCAVRLGGKILFEKTREPHHLLSEIFYVDDRHPFLAYHKGILVARELGHKPLTMVGRLSNKYYNKGALPEGEPFPVKSVWVPKEGVDWDNQYWYDGGIKLYKKLYRCMDPLEFLNA